MPDTHALAVSVGAGLRFNVTPGPDVLHIVGRRVSQGRLAGVVSARGTAAGDEVRYASAAYLAWIGVTALRSRAAAFDTRTPAASPRWRILAQSAFTNLLNPCA
mgnify:CR=1 FL=1|jgi:threonine/homoserine/homoserine lactone efflux protein